MRRSISDDRGVHIATRGCFEPDLLPGLRRDPTGREGGGALEARLEAAGFSLGLLSRLAFAGVDADPSLNCEDAFLSAVENQNLNPRACDLAVLSARETALGSERAGEGLMNLRRVFEVAGTEIVVSSLWKVDDRATAQLMSWFYENYWVAGMEKNEALHQAKLRMLRQNRADYGGDARPSTWGAFVLSGDWR